MRSAFNESGPLAIYISNLTGGGIERVAVNLANEIAERGLAVDLVLAKAEGAFLNQVRPRVRVVDLGASRVLTSLLALGRYVPALTRYIRRERPRAMLSIMNHANVIALVARRLSGIETRLIVSEHNNLSASIQRNLTAIGARCGPIMPWVMRCTYPWADRVVAVSMGVADDLAWRIKLPRKKIDVIYNPAVTDQIALSAVAPLHHPWFAPGEPPVILGVGHLITRKGFDLLLGAFAKLRKTCPARLVIIGEGRQRPVLEALINQLGIGKDAALAGFQANPFNYMRHAALFVLSSDHEGLPTVLIEAMACGTSVISTNCPSGPAEILENGKWGRLVPTGNVDALADAMLATLADTKHPDVAQRAKDFTVEMSVDRYMDVLLDLSAI